MIDFKKHFHDAAAFECNPESGFYKPSAAFEIAHGLSGIAAYYQFPALTVEGESRSLSFFFEKHVCQNYSRPVFDCYKILPDNEFHIEEISKLSPVVIASMKKDWLALTVLNPELGKIGVDMDSPLNLFHALEGSACLFNPEDIHFFVTQQRQTQSMQVFANALKLPDYAMLYREICTLAGLNHLGWVASPATMEQIKKWLNPRIF